MSGETISGRTPDGRKVSAQVTRRDNRVHLHLIVGTQPVTATFTGSSALDLAGHLADAASRPGHHDSGRQR